MPLLLAQGLLPTPGGTLALGTGGTAWEERQHSRTLWDLPTLVSWSAAADGVKRECGSQGYQRSHVLWEPLGKGFVGLRSQRNPAGPPEQEEGPGAKAGRDRQSEGLQEQRHKGGSGQGHPRSSVWGVGAKAGTASLEVRCPECHAEKVGREATQAETDIQEAGEE